MHHKCVEIQVNFVYYDSSVGKESTCSAGDTVLIYQVCQYLFDMAFLIAQLVKNLPAMQETLVRFLGQEDLLEKG